MSGTQFTVHVIAYRQMIDSGHIGVPRRRVTIESVSVMEAPDIQHKLSTKKTRKNF